MKFEIGKYLKGMTQGIIYTTAAAIASASLYTATPAYAQNQDSNQKSNSQTVQTSKKSQLENKLNEVKLDFYVVQPKDGFGKIARKYHAPNKYESLHKLNKDLVLTSSKIKELAIGQHIVVPYKLKKGKKEFVSLSKKETIDLLNGKYTCEGKCNTDRINEITSRYKKEPAQEIQSVKKEDSLEKKTFDLIKDTNELIVVTNKRVVNLEDSVNQMNVDLKDTNQKVDKIYSTTKSTPSSTTAQIAQNNQLNASVKADSTPTKIFSVKSEQDDSIKKADKPKDKNWSAELDYLFSASGINGPELSVGRKLTNDKTLNFYLQKLNGGKNTERNTTTSTSSTLGPDGLTYSNETRVKPITNENRPTLGFGVGYEQEILKHNDWLAVTFQGRVGARYNEIIKTTEESLTAWLERNNTILPPGPTTITGTPLVEKSNKLSGTASIGAKLTLWDVVDIAVRESIDSNKDAKKKLDTQAFIGVHGRF